MTGDSMRRLRRFKAFQSVNIEEVDQDARKRGALIRREFVQGFAFIKKYKKSVSIFGSTVMTEKDLYYQKAMSLGAKIVKLGYAVVTGGGSGIMEAANRGAFAAGGQSVGLTIKLPNEKRNKYLTDYMEFYYFFSRKVMFSFTAEAYVFFPGGYGTLDEVLEMIALMQTKRITKEAPIILFGSKFWKPFDRLIKDVLLKTYHTIDVEDSKIYRIENDEEKILKIIANAPITEALPFNEREEKF